MYCTHCGAKIDDNARFCPECGKSVSGDVKPQLQCQEELSPKAVKGSTAFHGPSFKKKQSESQEESRPQKTHISRAMINKVLAQLQDFDVNASATAGEVRFPTSKAQSMFMKFIKKGLLLLCMMLFFGGTAYPQVYKKTYDIKQLQGKLQVEIEGIENVKFLKDESHKIGSKGWERITHEYEANYTTRKITLRAVFSPNSDSNMRSEAIYGITLDSYEIIAADTPPGYNVVPEAHYKTKINLDSDEYHFIGDAHTRSTPGGSVSLSHTYTIPDNQYGMVLFFTVELEEPDPKKNGSLIAFMINPDEFVFYLIPGAPPTVEVVDTDASSEADPVKPTGTNNNNTGSTPPTKTKPSRNDSPSQGGNTPPPVFEEDNDDGIGGWWIPISIIGPLVGWKFFRGSGNKKGGDNTPKSFKNNSSGKKKKDNDEDEEDDEEVSFEMRVKKDFGDTLIPGQTAGTVGACIVRIDKNGVVSPEPELTQYIEIMGDGYAQIGSPVMSGSYLCAQVSAPESDSLPSEAVVTFRLSSSGGRFDNRLHFRVRKAEIIFGQENLTLPAIYDEVVRLPFLVDGLNDPDVSVEITGSRDEANPDYEVEVEYNAEQNLRYAVITEKLKSARGQAGYCDFYTIHVKATSGNAVIEGSLPLYRYTMGLRIEMLGNVGCYLEEYDPARHVAPQPNASADGKRYVPAETKMNVKLYDYDMETHKLKVWSPGLQKDGNPVGDRPVLTDYRVIPEEENRLDLIKHLHLTCDVRGNTEKSDSGTGRLCILSCKDAVLDAPNRFNAAIELTAQVGDRTYTAKHNVRLLSQPIRHYDPENDKTDERIEDGLLLIKQNIWTNGWYQNLFPLVHMIDIVLDGYDPEFGYDRSQIKTIQEVYLGFLDGSVAGANAEPETLTLGDYVRMYVGAFAQTTTSVKKLSDSIPGMMVRFTLGYVTIGASEAAYEAFDLVAYSVEMGQGVVEAVENGDDKAVAILTVGAKIMYDEGSGRLLSLGAEKVMSTKTFMEARNTVMKKGEALLEKGKNYFAGIRSKATANAAKKSAQATEKAIATSKGIDHLTGNQKALTPEQIEMQKAFEHNQAIAKENIENLQAALVLFDANPTVANLKLRNQLVVRCQESKSTIYHLQNYDDKMLDKVRAEFNSVIKEFHDGAYENTARLLSKKYGIPAHKIERFKATSANATKVTEGRKVPVDSDTTLYYKDADGTVIYFDEKEVQELYNQQLYRQTQGVRETDQIYADRHAQNMDSTVIEDVFGNAESFGSDVHRMIDSGLHGEALKDPGKVSDAIRYKMMHWHKQKQNLLESAKEVTDALEKTKILAKADECGREGYRQLVKIYDNCMNPRDVERCFKNNGLQISDKVRNVVEIMRGGSDAVNPKSLVKIEQELEAVGMTMEMVADEFAKLPFLIG